MKLGFWCLLVGNMMRSLSLFFPLYFLPGCLQWPVGEDVSSLSQSKVSLCFQIDTDYAYAVIDHGPAASSDEVQCVLCIFCLLFVCLHFCLSGCGLLLVCVFVCVRVKHCCWLLSLQRLVRCRDVWSLPSAAAAGCTCGESEVK